ncbi:ribosome production factor 1 [Carex littledalei]|uniref:Ribosome production factor 1 n=1 Tax=Carex littledalei TaxID=544730 RepID=A0A833QSR8_9POAL|nr:ribosome production factor 1 [Carex littledalei]
MVKFQPAQKMVPRTIENTREADETVIRPNDEEFLAGNDADEFSTVLKHQTVPKVLITTCRYNSSRGPGFIKELLSAIPNAHYYKRGTYELKKIVEYANNKEFTSVIVVHTNRREPDALLIIGLPDGPTAHFRLSNLVLRKDIKNHGNPTSHKPELVLNNFTTRLGNRIGRMIQSLFPQDPNFRGRRVVTFHNQRDFIFFRHHRYIFEVKEKKEDPKDKKSKALKEKTPKKVIARLQECGPRFTLKLVSLQHGTFDTKGGEFEWVHKDSRVAKCLKSIDFAIRCYHSFPQDKFAEGALSAAPDVGPFGNFSCLFMLRSSEAQILNANIWLGPVKSQALGRYRRGCRLGAGLDLMFEASPMV